MSIFISFDVNFMMKENIEQKIFTKECLERIHPSIVPKIWYKGDLFSLYSSESGYKKVAELLKEGIDN